MQLKLTVLAAAVAASLCGALPTRAQTAQDFDELRQEVRRLRDEVAELKKSKANEAKPAPAAPSTTAATAVKPADPTGWGERIAVLETQQREAAAAPTALPGGFRLPGSKTSLRLYGYAEAHAIHDIKQTSTPDVFTDLPNQPLNNAGGLTGQTQFTVETSRIGFESSTPTSLGTLSTRIEGDFYSYNNDSGRNRLRLRLAYGEIGGWLVGQNWSTFMDLDDFPETIDFTGPIGAPFARLPMVRYSFGDARAGYKFTFAVEDPINTSGDPGSANPAWPQFVARFDQAYERGQFNVRAVVDPIRSPTETKYVFGFGVGGNLKLTDKDVLMGQYTIADGSINNLAGANGYTIDANGSISVDRNQGLVLGWARTYNEQWRSNVAYGMNFGKTAELYDNRRLYELFVNAIYSPIKNVELGAEYIYGQRSTFSGQVGTLSRFDLMGRFSF
jgi:hypothetical protein